MDAIEAPVAIGELTASDLDACLLLSRESGWNQTGDDWLQFLSAGTVFGLRGDCGRPIATAALLPAPPVTWISMVLVTQARRRRGLADRLICHCIGTAQAMGLEPWLDATPAGAAVYARMGFAETGFGLLRMRRPAVDGSSMHLHDAGETRLPVLARQDRDALGFDRLLLLTSLARRDGSTVAMSGTSVALLRDGDRARHIGPLYAEDPAEAVSHLDRILTEERGPLLIDVASARIDVSKFLQNKGFSVERSFSRMRLGHSAVATPSARLIAACGPEYG